MSFESDMEKAFSRKVDGLLDKVTRKVVLDIQADLDRSTPVDTGRARSNWLGSIGTPRSDKQESFGGSPLFNFAGYKNGVVCFITNNLPYIKALNQGHSKQAPAGFVESVVQRNVNRIKEAVRSIRL